MCTPNNFVIATCTSLLSLITHTSCASTATPIASTAQSSAQNPAPSTAMPMQMMQMPMLGGWHHSSAYGRLYFQGSEVSLQGVVIESGSVIPQPHMMQGSQIILRVDSKRYVVHLGPAWYIQQQGFSLLNGDQITVVGRLIGEGASAFVIASQLTKGEQVFSLRDKDGIPFWAGVRMRNMPMMPGQGQPQPQK